MSAVNCIEKGSEHRYGLWEEINEGKEGCRTCQECGFQRVLSMTEDIAEQIRKQKEALIFLSAFQKLDKNDTYILGYLYTILDDYVNYLGNEHKNTLLTIMEDVAKADSVDYQNATFISLLSTFLKTNAFNEFYDTLDEFKDFNADMFERVFSTSEIEGYHR